MHTCKHTHKVTDSNQLILQFELKLVSITYFNCDLYLFGRQLMRLPMCEWHLTTIEREARTKALKLLHLQYNELALCVCVCPHMSVRMPANNYTTQPLSRQNETKQKHAQTATDSSI